MTMKAKRAQQPRRPFGPDQLVDLSEIEEMIKADLEEAAPVQKQNRRQGSIRSRLSITTTSSSHQKQAAKEARTFQRSSSKHEKTTVLKTGHMHRSSYRPKLVEALQKRRQVLLISLALVFLSCVSQDTYSTLFHYARRLCGIIEVYERDSYVGYYEDRNEPVLDYISNPRELLEPIPTTSVAYVVTLRSCPERLKGCHNDPGHAFYDAAAVLQYHICEKHSRDNEDCTFYAIVHREAIYCMSPSGGTYDRVKVLEDLGYYVKIWGSDMAKSDFESSNYLRTLIEYESGINDYSIFNAWRLVEHDIVVLIDFSTLMLNRPDALYTEFMSNSSLQAMYTRDYAQNASTGYNMGVNTNFFLLKPSNDTFDDLNTIVKTSWYDHVHGWNGSTVTGFDCAMGSRGTLTYKYTVVSPAEGQELDRCLYGNANEDPLNAAVSNTTCRDGSETPCNDCRNMNTSDIFVANPRIVCGEPWDCYYDEDWDNETKRLCEAFHRAWYQFRYDLELAYMATQSDKNGTYHPDVFLGYCREKGWRGYELMLPDSRECVEGDTVTNSSTQSIESVEREQIFEVTTNQWTGNGLSCLSGYVTTPTNQSMIDHVVSFEIYLHGVLQESINKTVLASNSTALVFDNLVLSGLDPAYGKANTITAIITMDWDANPLTEDDHYAMSLQVTTYGSVTNWMYPSSSPSQSPTMTPAPTISAEPSAAPSAIPSMTPSESLAPTYHVTYGLQPSCNLTDHTSFVMCLDLTSTTQQVEPWMEHFAAARDFYEGIIIGDLEHVDFNMSLTTPTCEGGYPETIDDVYICASDATIDGAGENGTNILGSAGPYWVRGSGTNNMTGDYYWTTLTGFMEFDWYDIEQMVNDGRFESVVRHEMGHVLGIGTLWERNGLYNATSAPGSYTSGTRAEEAWHMLGCTGTLPVETDYGNGTAHSHWNEECLDRETMTGLTDLNMAFSLISVCALEDLGYTTNHSKADNYTIADLGNCGDHCPAAPGNTARRLAPSKQGLSKRRYPKTTKGEAKVKEYAKNRMGPKRSIAPQASANSNALWSFVGGDYLDVLYLEEGEIRVVGVRWDEVA